MPRRQPPKQVSQHDLPKRPYFKPVFDRDGNMRTVDGKVVATAAEAGARLDGHWAMLPVGGRVQHAIEDQHTNDGFPVPLYDDKGFIRYDNAPPALQLTLPPHMAAAYGVTLPAAQPEPEPVVDEDVLVPARKVVGHSLPPVKA